jgi:segregation and condensation protein B
MESSTTIGLIEAILFLENEPIDLAALRRITNLPRDKLIEAIQVLQDEYSKPYHGLEIREIEGAFCFTPKKYYWENVRSRYGRRNDKRLSRAALETLAIIAYSQPITKTEIESLRGVGADGMIKYLLKMDLIKIVGKKDTPGRPLQYGTTMEFLKKFNLSSIADLPKLDELDREKFSLYG